MEQSFYLSSHTSDAPQVPSRGHQRLNRESRVQMSYTTREVTPTVHVHLILVRHVNTKHSFVPRSYASYRVNLTVVMFQRLTFHKLSGPVTSWLARNGRETIAMHARSGSRSVAHKRRIHSDVNA